jgi:hypothetical protein
MSLFKVKSFDIIRYSYAAPYNNIRTTSINKNLTI